MKRKYANIYKDFLESEKSGGFILIFCTVVSILIANSAWGDSYLGFWHAYLGISFSDFTLKYSVEHWINDGLMAIFFLLVGLEIEREIYVGELRNIKKAMLPIIAALGGMMIPGLFHFAFNAGTETQSGFAIPMATDIAFALGILSLAGKNVPISVKIFLTALAIIDDLGAILIIAIFYTSDIAFTYLVGALGIFIALLVMNRLKVSRLSLYLIPGVLMWYCMLQSGVHATISGVLLAFAIPFNKHDDERNVSYSLQHTLHKPVAFGIIPLFALANTAIVLPIDIIGSLSGNNSLGIIFGLFAGKVIGIVTFCFLTVKLGLGKLYDGMTWKNLTGAGLLAGIGFTMSIFITNLAFNDPDTIVSSKLSILVASILSAVAGLILIKLAAKKQPVQ